MKIPTVGAKDRVIGKLKGLMTSTTPFGSFLITGFIAAKFIENGALSVLAHLATPL